MTNVLPPGLARPMPSPDGLDAPYWEGTRALELRVQRCATCGTFRWSPEWLCYVCHSFAVDWPRVEPTGVLFSFQRIWHAAAPALTDAGPYITVLVELPHAGGIRMLGNYAGASTDDLHIGTLMTAVFENHDTDEPYTLVHWR